MITAADAGTSPTALILIGRGQVSRGLQEFAFTVVYLSVLVKITGVCGSVWKLGSPSRLSLPVPSRPAPPTSHVQVLAKLSAVLELLLSPYWRTLGRKLSIVANLKGRETSWGYRREKTTVGAGGGWGPSW